jgi:serine/threonine-protein kinase BUR1
LKIADFGLARKLEPNNPKYTNLVVTRWYRPPELLMGATRYDASVDIWGAGCIFGELLKRHPILVGNSDMDQLQKVFMLCGTPTEENWPGFMSLPVFDPVDGSIQKFNKIFPRTIHERFPSN